MAAIERVYTLSGTVNTVPGSTGGTVLPTLTTPASADDIRQGKEVLDHTGRKLTGAMPEQAAQTITPSLAAQTISAGKYLAGDQIIDPVTAELLAQLDSDFAAENIRKNVELFGVSGSYEAPVTEPVIEALAVTENGTYEAPEGVDGYSPVTVNVAGSSGAELYNTPSGSLYTPNMVLKDMEASTQPDFTGKYSYATNLKTVETSGGIISAVNTKSFADCTSLETAILPNFVKLGHYFLQNCPNLKTVQLGSMGIPVLVMGSVYAFRNNTQSSLIITLYVDAETLADITSDVTENAPWGATNATIIYRNSTTGEVITA